VADSSWNIRRVWSPEWTLKSRCRVLSDPRTAHYIVGWPHDTDLGVIAEAGSQPAGAVWIRFFPADDPAYGFTSPDVPELTIGVAAGPSVLGRAIANWSTEVKIQIGDYRWLKRRRNKYTLPGQGVVAWGKVGGRYLGGVSGVPHGNNYNVMWREGTIYGPG
jgi:hypothetical protein